MPKVKPLIRRDPREIEVLDQIGIVKSRLRMSQNDLAKKCGISPAAMSQRVRNVGEMRLKELWILQDLLKGET